MGRRNKYHLMVGDGAKAQSVGYSSKERDGGWAVVFMGPDGRRLEKMTECKAERNRRDELIAPDAEYHTEVARIVAQAYARVYPTASRVDWDTALALLPADLREDTHIAYTKAVRILRETLAEANYKPDSPAAVTPEIAAQFGPLWLAGTYKRSAAKGAKEYRRKPTTMNFYLRQLSATWEQWLALKKVSENPWKSVRRAEVDKVRKRVPTSEEIEVFFAWVKARYPDWERLHALLELKSLAGCRTADICELRSDQLRGGRVVWEAAQTKNRTGRVVKVPSALFTTLTRLAGPTYLWEEVVKDLAKFRPSRPRPVTAFSPDSLYWVVCNLFKEYGVANPSQKHITPHSLRRHRITRAVTNGYDVDHVAKAIGLHPETARAYYLDAQQAFDSEEFFDVMAADLPKSAPTIPPQKQNNPEQPGTTRNNPEQE